MNVFIVYWHPEPKSFNHAMFVKACQTLADAGADVRTSDLPTMAFWRPTSSMARRA
jgi:NAD(P)H dehydrogenase (quinone)